MKKITTLLFILLKLSIYNLSGQTFKEIKIPVSINSKNLLDPFTGGWKCPNFSETDLQINEIYEWNAEIFHFIINDSMNGLDIIKSK